MHVSISAKRTACPISKHDQGVWLEVTAAGLTANMPAQPGLHESLTRFCLS
uniref:Uncharacterized protein n=1 Tax=Anguilla anguilla TaxID=7936 RepID=A0A0E9VQV2_ANGAN